MGFLNVDKLFTTITGEVSLLSTFLSLEELPTALDDIAITSGELSDAFDGMSTVVESLHLSLLICYFILLKPPSGNTPPKHVQSSRYEQVYLFAWHHVSLDWEVAGIQGICAGLC